jgi:uncharacterized membrane protein
VALEELPPHGEQVVVLLFLVQSLLLVVVVVVLVRTPLNILVAQEVLEEDKEQRQANPQTMRLVLLVRVLLVVQQLFKTVQAVVVVRVRSEQMP